MIAGGPKRTILDARWENIAPSGSSAARPTHASLFKPRTEGPPGTAPGHLLEKPLSKVEWVCMPLASSLTD